MRFFEFLHPDKSPPNARMPKRKKAKNLQKEQPTHTPHPHNENAPRSIHEYTPKFRKYHDCTLQVSTHPTKHPEVSQCAKLQGFGQPKTTLQVSTYPTKHPEVSQYAKIQSFGLPKTTLRVPLYSWGSGVSDYPTTQHTPTKHAHHTSEAFWGL